MRLEFNVYNKNTTDLYDGDDLKAMISIEGKAFVTCENRLKKLERYVFSLSLSEEETNCRYALVRVASRHASDAVLVWENNEKK